MTSTPATTQRCRHCGDSTAHWLTHFCRRCGRHHDHLYCLEAPDPRPRLRSEIITEYRDAGMTAEADRLAAEPDDAPHPSTEPTALVQRSLLDLLDSA